MSKYPAIIGSKYSVKQPRTNKIYVPATTAPTVKPVQKYQPKGPNMFKRMIKGLITWSMSEHNQEEVIADRADEIRLGANGIKFEVYRANGGTVIETRRNDRRTGDSICELHVVAGDQDIGEEIGKIITMEALKA